jgi:DOPA 4,5-dioxygenase
MQLIPAEGSSTPISPELQSEYDNEIKEFHFHVYWFQNNAASYESAVRLRDRILELAKQGFFQVVPLKNAINTSPRGPHPIGSYEVWCAREDFARCYSWFVLNRGQHSVLIHPLTREEVADHSSRAAWLGTPVPLDYSNLTPVLDHTPSQYPELGLGYNAPPKEEY